MDEKTYKHSLRNQKLKVNRTSETEEQRKERQRIDTKNIEQEGKQKTTRGKERVIRNSRPRDTAPGHSQKIEAR